MKTTLELPEALVRSAKSRAAKAGVSLKQFVTEAVREKLNGSADRNAPEPRWRKHAGVAREYVDELRQVDARIEAEFERIEPEDWK